MTKAKGHKRRYRKAAVTEEANGHYGLALDGKPVATPHESALRVPSRALADAIAAEWAAQGPEIDPLAMPLTRLANTAIDLVGPRRTEIEARTADFAGTDLICYWVAAPDELVERQTKGWQPMLDWAAERYGAKLATAAGVVAIGQPGDALAALAAAVAAHDDMRLAALAAATAALGSVVLALALAERRIDAEQAFALSQLDETYQAERWGADAEETRRRALLKAEIDGAARFLELLEG